MSSTGQRELEEYRQELIKEMEESLTHLEMLITQADEQTSANTAAHLTVILTHLLEGEANTFTPALQQILQQHNFDLQPVTENPGSVEGGELQKRFTEYKSLRRQLLNTLHILPPAAWNWHLRHHLFGVHTLQWWVEQSLVHLRTHLKSLAKTTI